MNILNLNAKKKLKHMVMTKIHHLMPFDHLIPCMLKVKNLS